MSDASSVQGAQPAGTYTITYTPPANSSSNGGADKKIEEQMKKLDELIQQLQQLQQAQKSEQNQASQDPQDQMDDLLKKIQQLTKDIKASKKN
ncbi:MAG: hypothetical protein JF606_19855 [Burkholderiales bacterium]|jgi:uncharacterized protein YukE|nr:hypothetical protein [Burkholderiales bacterium]